MVLFPVASTCTTVEVAPVPDSIYASLQDELEMRVQQRIGKLTRAKGIFFQHICCFRTEQLCNISHMRFTYLFYMRICIIF